MTSLDLFRKLALSRGDRISSAHEFEGRYRLQAQESLELGEIVVKANELPLEIEVLHPNSRSLHLNRLDSATLQVGHTALRLIEYDRSEIWSQLECTGMSNVSFDRVYSTWWKEVRSPQGNGFCRSVPRNPTPTDPVFEIRDFHHLGIPSRGMFKNTDGKVTHRFSFFNGGIQPSCALESSSNDWSDHHFNSCEGIPARFSCFTPLPEGGVKKIEMVVLDPSQFWMVNHTTRPEYLMPRFLMPKGQLIGFKKGFFGVSEVRLEEDDWVSVSLTSTVNGSKNECFIPKVTLGTH